METYLFGEREDIVAEITERRGVAFTIDSTTVTITLASDHTALCRKDVAASVEGNQVWYNETFNAANGYRESENYTATFACTCTRGTSTYIVKAVVEFEVRSVNDD